MKYRATAALAAVAALAALTACSGSGDAAPEKTTTPAASRSAGDATRHAAGIPPEPTGQPREDLPAALRLIDGDLVVDEGKAIDNSRNQCSAINGKSPEVVWSAQQRFSTSSHEVSAAEAKQIDIAIAEFCETA
ncbi:hypothetical protein FRZ03_16120 [Streptomyces misionensis]|uniref:DUF732 domain-containing protein n=1 Tax=Streptomyces misionensis TaxID=67331 RepID=A0A5C6JV04_9ACTN|nr:hypothetical protein [Streptomyces misionensis]TWV45626.1 hypothetical protein FRZ03_16120 [Streptomyces misionensis]